MQHDLCKRTRAASPPVLIHKSSFIKFKLGGMWGFLSFLLQPCQFESMFNWACVYIVSGQSKPLGELADLISLPCPGKRELFSLSAIFIISRASGADCAWHSWWRSVKRLTTWQGPGGELGGETRRQECVLSCWTRCWAVWGIRSKKRIAEETKLMVDLRPTLLSCLWILNGFQWERVRRLIHELHINELRLQCFVLMLHR